jgi:predicted phage tail protein
VTQVLIPTPLRSYTREADRVEVEGATVDDVLKALDVRYPGFRFRIINEQDRIREHIKIFVDEELMRDVRAVVPVNSRLHIICALSGG